MKHARKDYDRIQDPALADPSLLSPGSTPIGEEEPVFLLRAQDKYFLPMLRQYIIFLATDGDGDPKTTTLLYEHHHRAKLWQDEHGCKAPDL